MNEPFILLVPSDDQTQIFIEIPVLSTAMPCVTHGSTRTTDEITLHSDLAVQSELAIARVLHRHSLNLIYLLTTGLTL